jgi:hypothetical protein
MRGEDPAALTAAVLDGRGDALLAPHRLRPILEHTARSGHRSVPPNPGLKWYPDETLPWPLSDWLVGDVSRPLEAMQLLEGVAHLYAAVLSGIRESKQPARRVRVMGESASFVSNWARLNSNHPLSKEASVVSAVLRGAVPARNAVAHSTPGQDLREAEKVLVDAANRLADEIRHLRQAKWISRSPAVMSVAGFEVDLSASISVNGEDLLSFAVEDRIIAVEQSMRR